VKNNLKILYKTKQTAKPPINSYNSMETAFREGVYGTSLPSGSARNLHFYRTKFDRVKKEYNKKYLLDELVNLPVNNMIHRYKLSKIQNPSLESNLQTQFNSQNHKNNNRIERKRAALLTLGIIPRVYRV
jgi:hypothetical protein